MKGCFLNLVFVAVMFAQAPPRPAPFPPSCQVHISPTVIDGARNTMQEAPNYWAAYGFSLGGIVSTLWNVPGNRIFVPAKMDPESLYDFVVVPPRQLAEEERLGLLRTAVEKYFQVQIVKAKRSMQVYVLSAPHGKSSALEDETVEETELGQIRGSGLAVADREVSGHNVQMSEICEIIERFEKAVVIDETNLKGRYSFHVYGNDSFKGMLEEQLGLTLTRMQREVDVLLIERR